MFAAAEIRASVVAWAAGFDPALVSGADARVVLREASRIEKAAAAVVALAAARVSETSQWRDRGAPSPAHDIAKETGSSSSRAMDRVRTGNRLRDLDATRSKALAGDLSTDETSAIADAAAKNPDAEQSLLDTAASDASLGELHDACAKAKAAVEPDPEAKQRQIHARRSLREYTDRDGAWNLHVRNTTVIGAQIRAALAPFRDKVFTEARKAGRRETYEAYAADALTEALCGTADAKAKATGSDAKVIFRIDLDAFLRGHTEPGETCELAGHGPVPVSAVRDLMDTAAPFIAAVITRGVDVINVAHLARKPTAHQRTALQWLQPTCTVVGCNRIEGLQIDHRADWADTHLTWLEWLDRLCRHHHNYKTLFNWALIEGRGKRDFVAPDDPRHPAHARSRAPAA